MKQTLGQAYHGLPVPPASTANIAGNPQADERMAEVIMVTSDVISRLYGGLYVLTQVYLPQFKAGNTEAPLIMGAAIQHNLIEPLTRTFPDFAQFDFTISEKGSIIGNNVFTNSVLGFMQKLMNSPIVPGQDVPDELKPTMHLGNDIWVPEHINHSDDEYDE